jgi:corrinoid protein of di/trimethylamine methyltransferase
VGIKEKLAKAIRTGDIKKSVEMAERALAEGVSSLDLSHFLIVTIREIGDAFERFEIFLPDMMMASDAMIAIMKILEPRLQEESAGGHVKSGHVLLATVKGDTHEIGKNIVKTLFKANRFEVLDLGADVDSLEVVKTAEREGIDLIGLSALMTTTMPGQKEVIEVLKAKGQRDNVKVIIGGAPTNQDWADRIGADGWAADAASAVLLAEKLLDFE